MSLLETAKLTAFYGDFQALFGVDMEIDDGETVAIIGANGAGKTTFMRSLSGVIANAPEMVNFDGQLIGGLSADRIASLGIAMVPEGRRLFPSLSVEENIDIGNYGRKVNGYWTRDRVYELFPILKEKRHAPGTELSGGQQQMVAIGRALMSNPRVLLCDEISLGLAPVVIRSIYESIPVIRESGASLVIVEQDVSQAMAVADRVYCMMEGRITLEGEPSSLSRDAIHDAYFGGGRMIWLDTLVQGILLGGLYALFATGLSLVFGIMRLVNLAHGDLIVCAAYLILLLVTLLGLSPFVAALIAAPLMFAAGWVLQRGLLNRTLGTDILPPLLVTFGLSVALQNALLEGFSADSRRLPAEAISTASVDLGVVAVGVLPLLTLATAVAVIVGLNQLFYRTELGRAFRATSDDPVTASLMGIRPDRIFASATAIAMLVVTLAALYLGMRANFDPTIGPARLIYAFEAVIIGGLGSLWGTLAGGIIIGLAQTIGAAIDPEWQILSGHLAFLVVLILRPRGLFPRAVD